MKNKPPDVDNDLDKTKGKIGESISVSDYSIKGDGEIVSVLACKSDKEVEGVSWGSGKVRVGWL